MSGKGQKEREMEVYMNEGRRKEEKRREKWKNR